MAVAGASRYINSATLANTAGISPSLPTLIGNSSASLLDAGRRINRSGIGLSPESRALTDRFLNRTNDVNSLFTLGAGASLSVQGLQTQILALRASVPQSQISQNIIDSEAEIAAEDAANARQQIIDQVLSSVAYKFGLGQAELDELVERELRRAGYNSAGELVDQEA
jgi:hypothetical protein